MGISPGLRTQLQGALIDAFPTLEELDGLVQDALHIARARITTANGLEAIVGDLLDHCAAGGSAAALVCAAYNRNPSNRLISRLVAQASGWPELSAAGLALIDGTAYVCASRQAELVYLGALIERYKVWAERYTPLAGIAEVRAAASDGPRLDLPMLFMPTGFEKLEEHFGMQREVKRAPVADLRQAVDEHKRLVLLGEPGSGKTTTLWRLTYDLAQAALADPAAPLPLLAPLGAYTGPESVLEFAQDHFGDLGPHLPAYLRAGRVVLLLDGLNEMPQRGRKARVSSIQALLERNDGVRALVTCRVLDYASGDAEPLKLEKLEVKPLDPERQRAYLHRYLGKGDGEKLFWQLTGDEIAEVWRVWQAAGGAFDQFWTAEKMPPAVYSRTSGRQDRLWADLRSGQLPPLLVLGVNPFMLVMLAQVYAAQHGSLPQNRGKLFAAFVDTLLAREEKRCDEGVWPGAQPLAAALARLAYAMQSAGERGTAVERAWALAHLGDGCDPEQALVLAAGATLLDLAGERVRFVHQLIQEYFAAVAWRGKWEAGADLKERWPEDWLEPRGWEETAILLAGILPAMDQFVDDLLAVNPPLAARCLAESGGKRPDAACIGRVQGRLIAVAIGTEFSVKHRALAADGLNHVGDPRPGVGLREDGLPDIVWCPVPAGEFTMGNTKETDEMADDDEAPQHRLHLGDFSIAKYPVTSAQYAAFVGDGGYERKQYWTQAGWRWRSEENIMGPYSFGGDFDLPNHPVVGVRWYEAAAFCNWLSEKLGRAVTLPSEAQWEKAARGTDGRRYPWGPEISPEHANYNKTGLGTTSVVGIFSRGESPCGALDMSGNVWEWCSTKWRDNYRDYKRKADDDLEGGDNRTLRGGSFRYAADWVRCAYRGRFYPNGRYGNFGFRVVVSSPAFGL